jgi:hypothetical protein
MDITSKLPTMGDDDSDVMLDNGDGHDDETFLPDPVTPVVHHDRRSPSLGCSPSLGSSRLYSVTTDTSIVTHLSSIPSG